MKIWRLETVDIERFYVKTIFDELGITENWTIPTTTQIYVKSNLDELATSKAGLTEFEDCIVW